VPTERLIFCVIGIGKLPIDAAKPHLSPVRVLLITTSPTSNNDNQAVREEHSLL
jgi:hypothetical protein